MKRVGHIYEQLWDWNNLVRAEYVATNNKGSKAYVRHHAIHRIPNLVEIQQMLIDKTICTSNYIIEQRVSGQNKLRDIAKLHFHPSHIYHQALVLGALERVEKGLIRHTYASRIGYGQLRCALQIKKNLRNNKEKYIWYAQGDIRKYYQSIPHPLIRKNLEHLFKDKLFVDFFMEPFEKFSSTNIKVPLGIRPSQIVGNLVLSPFDHFMTMDVKANGYVRYLDDFAFFGSTKGEVKRKMARAVKFLTDMGFQVHVPIIRKVSEGLDMMGFVFYGTRKDMWWRKSNKAKWLRRRSKVTNPRRKNELDMASWGMLKWGNSDGRKLFTKYTGLNKDKKMPVKFNRSGIKKTENCDSNGIPFIEGNTIGIRIIIGQKVEILRWVKNIHTHHGDGRYVLQIVFNGATYKMIVNSFAIKNLIDDMERNGVTKFTTIFTEERSRHYDYDADHTDILEIQNRKVTEINGVVYFEDNKEEVHLN